MPKWGIFPVEMRYFCTITAFLASFTAGSLTALADCGTPCFQDNDDILSGERQLLRNDDLVYLAGTPGNYVNRVFPTSMLTLGTSTDFPIPGQGTSFVPLLEVGRVFALPNDVIVNVVSNSNSQRTIAITDPNDANNNSATTIAAGGPALPSVMMADFDQDGFQDLFFLSSSSVQVYTAKCSNDPVAECTGTGGNAISDGMIAGPRQGLSNIQRPIRSITPSGLVEPVAGDFNADGILDVAWFAQGTNSFGVPSGPVRVVFVSVCPAASVEVFGQTCNAALQIISAPTTIVAEPNTTLKDFSLAAGNFDGSGPNAKTGAINDELVLVVSSDSSISVRAFSFDANMTANPGPGPLTINNTLSTFSVDGRVIASPPVVASGQLDWDSLQDQVVIGYTVPNADSSLVALADLAIVDFARDLTMTGAFFGASNPNPNASSDNGTYTAHIAIGRFDPPDTNNNTNFNEQIGYFIIGNNPQGPTGGNALQIFKSERQDKFAPIFVSGVSATPEPTVFQPSGLAAGDTQGRSLTLGAPSIVRVEHMQPDTVLGMPPSHIDFITPDGISSPVPFNLSVYPPSFNTEYTFSDSTKTSSSRTTSTSYTAATTESFEQKVSYKELDVGSASVDLKETATQTHSRSVTKQYSQYQGNTFNLAAGTAQQFGDQVAYTSRIMNIYTYPVIGRAGCAAGFKEVTVNSELKCCPSDKVSHGTCTAPSDAVDPTPLTVQYSGPDTITHHLLMPASNLEFFQPPYEVGQVLSYPGNLAQLEADISGLQLKTATGPALWPQQSSAVTTVTWVGGSTDGSTTGTTSNHSFDGSVSVSGSVDVFGDGISVSDSFDYSESSSTSTLNSSSNTSDASRGVTVNRGIDVNTNGQNTNPAFQYNNRTFIFGQALPSGSIQSDLVVSADIPFDGIPWVAFTATPYQQAGTNTGTSAWWLQAYGSRPDIALTHPTRWTVSLTNTDPVNTQFLFNCPLGFTSTFTRPACRSVKDAMPALTDCNASNVNNVANACAFYNMKGFFLTTNAAENKGGVATSTPGAPFLTTAVAGESLTLRARVSNYSLKNMTSDETVYVQFYAQPVASNGDFENSTATFIGTASFGGDLLPAPCGGPVRPQPCQTSNEVERNWVLAEVVWDTSTLPDAIKEQDSFWRVWGVAWAHDSKGVVTEIADHGVDFSAPANPKMAVPEWTSFVEVPVELYSNNVGFYGQVFTLTAPATETNGEASPLAQDLDVIAIKVDPDQPLRRRYNTVRATVLATGGTADFVVARFSDLDPTMDGSLFDINIIPRLQGDTEFVTKGAFIPDSCGWGEVVVEAIPHGGGLPTARSSTNVFVTTDPVDDIGALAQAIDDMGLTRTKRILQAKLLAAANLFAEDEEIAGIARLEVFIDLVARQSGLRIPSETADGLIAEAQSIIDCL